MSILKGHHLRMTGQALYSCTVHSTRKSCKGCPIVTNPCTLNETVLLNVQNEYRYNLVKILIQVQNCSSSGWVPVYLPSFPMAPVTEEGAVCRLWGQERTSQATTQNWLPIHTAKIVELHVDMLHKQGACQEPTIHIYFFLQGHHMVQGETKSDTLKTLSI